MQFNKAKFKALVHYICRECHDPDKLGKVKLHKILWFSDGQHFVKTGDPITGEKYIKHQYGPFSTHLAEAVEELTKEGLLYTREVNFHNRTKTEFIGKGTPNTSLFSEKELRLIDANIKHITEDHTATSISDRSHNYIWDIAELYEELPYEALLATRFAPVTEDDFAWAKKEIERLSA